MARAFFSWWQYWREKKRARLRVVEVLFVNLYSCSIPFSLWFYCVIPCQWKWCLMAPKAAEKASNALRLARRAGDWSESSKCWQRVETNPIKGVDPLYGPLQWPLALCLKRRRPFWSWNWNWTWPFLAEERLVHIVMTAYLKVSLTYILD